MRRTLMGAAALTALWLLLLIPTACASGIYTGEEGVAGISDMLKGWFDEDTGSDAGQSGSVVSSAEDVQRIYGFTLEGVRYEFPCPMAQLLGQGWTYAGWAADPGAGLDAMTYGSALLTNAQGKRVTVDIMNPTESPVAVADARLMSITIRESDAPPAFSTAGGLSLGAQYADAMRIYGDEYTEYDMSDGGKTCRYNFYRILNNTSSYIGEPLTQSSGEDELTVISNANGVITSIHMMHAAF